jgi:V-type H+-transporting ATPase subunit e
MGNPETIMMGTVIYAIITVVLALPLSFYVKARTKSERQRQDNFNLTWIICAIGGTCFWLMWLCCFMHQMHPLVTPDTDN